MRRAVLAAVTLALVEPFHVVTAQAAASGPAVPPPPAAPREEVVDVLHGTEVRDPYRWLEDRDDPRTQRFVEEQEARTRAVLDALPGRERLEELASSFIRLDWTGVPHVAAGRAFFTTRAADQEQHVLRMREGRKERVLVDPHALDPTGLTSVSLMAVSHDGRRAAYGTRVGGADEIELRVLDVDAGEPLPDVLPRARYTGVAFAHDGSGFWYSRHSKEGPRLRWHAMGTDPASDRDVFGDGFDPGKGVSPQVSHDGRWLVVTTWYGSAAPRTDVHVKDLRADGPFEPIVFGIESRFWGSVGDGVLYLRTDMDAPRGRVIAIDLEHPVRERWREVVPQQDAILDGLALAGGRLVLEYLEQVEPVYRVVAPDGRVERTLRFETLGAVGDFDGSWDEPHAYLSFSSWTAAPAIWKLDVRTGRRTAWEEVPIPLRAGRYVVERVEYASTDGVRVPMFVARAKDAPRDGRRPVLLTGYGGFLQPMQPSYSARMATWLELGGMVAAPCLRGGGEFGEEWHRAGMLDRKQQTFDDFVRAGEHLVAEGWTSPERLGIWGRSNGGLLVGAAITQRPDLWGAAVIGYPLLDMARYHRFLVARFWVPEYGSADDPEPARWLLAYSPYHRVVEGARYPATLLVTGDSDTRVDPSHARKMTALLQHATGSGEPVLLHYDFAMGHVGGQPAARQVEELCDELAFLAWQLGVPLEAAAQAARPGGPRRRLGR